MTIASVNINLQLALPQGWTQAEVEERVMEMVMGSFQRDPALVEFEIAVEAINSDPFNHEGIF